MAGARRVAFGTPAVPALRGSDRGASLTVERREDGSFRVAIVCRGRRGGERREAVVLTPAQALLIVDQWTPLVAEGDLA